MKKIVSFTLFALCFIMSMQAQIGISVSPPRVYYEIAPGQTSTEKVVITNVSTKHALDLSITLGDWMYNQFGENLIFPADSLNNSCASWININGGSYISLKPGESKAIEVSLTTPINISDSIPVHTAMLYVTQMNPIDDVDQKGANIKVSVRSGIKLFYRTPQPRRKKIDIQNLVYNKETNSIQLYFDNTSNVWTDGNISTDLLSKTTGKETHLNNIIFYTMPNDKRMVNIPIPKKVEKGSYTATILIDYADDNNIEAAELQFSYE